MTSAVLANATAVHSAANKPARSSSAGVLLQRKCACGASTGSVTDTCEDCQAKTLQFERMIGSNGGDQWKLEAPSLAQPGGRQDRPGHDFASMRVHWDPPLSLHQIAKKGVTGKGGPVPFQSEIQPLMPGLDLSTVHAHSGSATDAALRALGANAYATGNDLGLPANASRHLVAHELAHIAQQREGVKLKGGVGEVGDVYEIAADAIADRVVSGRSAAALMPATTAPRATESLQLDVEPRRQEYLNQQALRLGKRQASRRRFFDKFGDLPSFMLNMLLDSEDFRKELVALDIEWVSPPRVPFGMRRPKGTFRSAASVEIAEKEVRANPEADAIYRRTVWDETVNWPAEKSWLDHGVGFVCEHTSPCKETMAQFRANVASGMSIEEARKRGLFGVFAWGIQQGLSISVPGSSGPRGEAPRAGPWTRPLDIPAPATGGSPSPIALRGPNGPMPGPVFPPPFRPKRDPIAKPRPDKPIAPPIAEPEPGQSVAPPKTTPPIATLKPKSPTSTPKPASTDPEGSSKAAPTPNLHPATDTKTSPDNDKRPKRCRTICDQPLPIRWPVALPGPSTTDINRNSRGSNEYQANERGYEQERLRNEIAEAFENHRRGRPREVPDPCFEHDRDPNALHDAHHKHPLYLGGYDTGENLCALRRQRHQRGHAQLNDQSSMAGDSTWTTCRMCSSFLPKHDPGQMYEIVGRK
jgi:hypothetical protein